MGYRGEAPVEKFLGLFNLAMAIAASAIPVTHGTGFMISGARAIIEGLQRA
jgi:hypothetical protein